MSNKQPKTFRQAVRKMLSDKKYSIKIRDIVIKAQKGDLKANELFKKEFHITPEALAKLPLTPKQQKALLTSIPCGVVATLVFSCVPGTCESLN